MDWHKCGESTLITKNRFIILHKFEISFVIKYYSSTGQITYFEAFRLNKVFLIS